MADGAPADPVGQAVAEALRDLVLGAHVAIDSAPHPPAELPSGTGVAAATGPGPGGRHLTVAVTLDRRTARLLEPQPTALGELLAAMPRAAVRTAAQLHGLGREAGPARAALWRAVRDTLAGEILAEHLAARLGTPVRAELVAETIDYLIELSGTRVEAHDLTHGVVITDALRDVPRLELRYPDDLRSAKRAPLLFDGRRSVLIVDPAGRARTELQAHRFDRLGGVVAAPRERDGWLDSGALVARGTSSLGGVGFYVRADRSIWTFADGRPLLVRRGEHWTAFPVELAASIGNMIGGGPAAEIVALAAFMISARPQGAILAIVDNAADLDGAVPLKDRFDLRDEIDPPAMRPETRLHHLLDAEPLDAETLARLAELDGATVIDRDARLLAYGAIVTTSDSEHEGARTAAARTLSHVAQVVLKVSVDGDITVFRDGGSVTTLLGHPATAPPPPRCSLRACAVSASPPWSTCAATRAAAATRSSVATRWRRGSGPPGSATGGSKRSAAGAGPCPARRTRACATSNSAPTPTTWAPRSSAARCTICSASP
jgi:hypothetical protein